MNARFLTPRLAVAADVQKSAPLKVAGIYADLPAHALAMRVLGDVSRQCSAVCEINAVWWSFDTLKSADAHEAAARAASEADMIWCSTHACEALPHAVRAWLDESSEHRHESDAALVALLRCPHGYKIEQSPARIYLSKTAQAAGMELFVQRFDCACRGLLNPPPSVLLHIRSLIDEHHPDWHQLRHWGINE